MATKKKQDIKVTRVRNAIIALVALVVLLVVGYGIVYTSGITQGEFQVGTHYEIIEGARARRAGEPVRVQEFFSYGCVHCRNFDPLIEDWRKTLPEGVVFTRTPAAFSPTWALLSQTYYALEEVGALEQNHERLFGAIHDSGRQFLTANAVADFVAGQGVTREQFLQALSSPAVRRKVGDAEVQQRDMGISSVPTLVVDGRYRISMDVGRKTALDVANHVIALELSGEAPK